MRQAIRLALEHPRKPPISLKGKTVVVTGASSGLGWGTSRVLRQRGADLVVVARAEREARRLRAAIGAVPGSGSVEAVAADLASKASVEALAAALGGEGRALYALVHCAGLRLPERTRGDEGIEAMFAVEVLAPFLLTNRLLPALERGAPSRVILVAGEGHRSGWRAPRRLEPDNLQGERAFAPGAHGKHLALARILLVQEFARRFAGSEVTALAVAPVPTHTGLFRHFSPYRRALAKAGLFLRRAVSPEVAAEYLAHALTDPELEGTSGRYLLQGAEVVPSPAARDRKAAEALWEHLEVVVGESFRSGGGKAV